MSDGMFLSACRQVAKEFPQISYDEDLLDRACLRVSICGLSSERLYLIVMVDHSKSRSLLGPGYGDAEFVWRHLVGYVRWPHRRFGTDTIRKHRTGERPFPFLFRITPDLARRMLRFLKPSMAQHPILLARAWPTLLLSFSPP